MCGGRLQSRRRRIPDRGQPEGGLSSRRRQKAGENLAGLFAASTALLRALLRCALPLRGGPSGRLLLRAGLAGRLAGALLRTRALRRLLLRCGPLLRGCHDSHLQYWSFAPTDPPVDRRPCGRNHEDLTAHPDRTCTPISDAHDRLFSTSFLTPATAAQKARVPLHLIALTIRRRLCYARYKRSVSRTAAASDRIIE